MYKRLIFAFCIVSFGATACGGWDVTSRDHVNLVRADYVNSTSIQLYYTSKGYNTYRVTWRLALQGRHQTHTYHGHTSHTLKTGRKQEYKIILHISPAFIPGDTVTVFSRGIDVEGVLEFNVPIK
jgi:hypothetical protein